MPIVKKVSASHADFFALIDTIQTDFGQLGIGNTANVLIPYRYDTNCVAVIVFVGLVI